ncbi:MAG: glycosyltransferase family 4 protein [Novosphingobium sp.]
MKVVLISGIPILPAHEGNRSRILALSRAIRDLGHDLWVVVMPSGLSMPNDRAAHMAEFGADRFVEIPPENPLARFIRRFPFRLRRKLGHILRLPGRFYGTLDGLYEQSWSGPLERLHREHGFDAAMVEYVIHSAALDLFPANVRKIIDTHDSFADRHKPYVAKGLYDYFYSLRSEDEARGFRRADAILAIQQEEAETFDRQLGDDPDNPEIAVVNHFLDLSAAPVSNHSPCRALFLASRNPANTISAQNFVAHVLPLVLEKLPEFRLVLAGMICEVVDDHPAVIKLGRVDQLSDAFEQAPLLVNPMLVGTGINIKILDAMAAGVPVVSTDMGARGLPDEFRSSVLTVPATDNEALAAQLVSLLRHEALRRDLGLKARRNAERWNELQHEELRVALQGGHDIPPIAMTGT